MIGYEPKNGMTYRHSNIIDWMLQNPERPLKEAADETGFTPQYLYMIRKSDMFRAEYERRRSELEAALHVDMLDKWKQVEDELLDKMILKLKGPVTEKFIQIGLEAVNKRLAPASVNIDARQTTNILASPEMIRQARERAAELARGRGQEELTATHASIALEPAGKSLDVEVEVLA